MSRFFVHLQRDEKWPFDLARGIELGAGCGVVGISLHKLGTFEMILTDQPRLIRLIEQNVTENKIPHSVKNIERTKKKKRKPSNIKSSHAGVKSIHVTDLDWSLPISDPLITRDPLDFVVVSDCVYHEDVVPLLISTMAQLSKYNHPGSKTMLFVGQEFTIRDCS